MPGRISAAELSRINTEASLKRHERRRRALGLKPPTAHERELRKARNLRYRANRARKLQEQEHESGRKAA